MKLPSLENRCLFGCMLKPTMCKTLHPLQRFVAIGAAVLCLFSPFTSRAVMGDLDTTFYGAGTRINTVGSGFIYGDSAVQPDGKIVTVGTCSFPDILNPAVSRKNFCATRHNVDGSTDASFGVNGLWYDRDSGIAGIFRSFDSVASSVLILSDGKILIGGTCRSNQACMARLTSAGVRDIPFMRETTYAAVTASPTTRLAETASGDYLIQYSRVTATNDRQLATVANFTPGGVPNILFGTNGVFLELFSSPNFGYSPKGIVTLGDTMWLGGEVATAGGRYLRMQKVTRFGVTDQSSGINSSVTQYLGTVGQSEVFSIGAITANAVSSIRIVATVITNGKLGVYRMDDTGYADDAWFFGGLKASATNARDPGPACQYSGGIALPVGGYVFTGSHFDAGGVSGNSGNNAGGCLSQFDNSLNPLVTSKVNVWFNGALGTSPMVRPTLAKLGTMLVAGDCGFLNQGAACLQRYDILPKNCYDMDGDGLTNPRIDGIILARLLAGFTGDALSNGITVDPDAPTSHTPRSPAQIQSHFNSCQYSQYSSCYRVTGLSYVSAKGLLYDGLAVVRAQQGLRGEALRLGDGNTIAQNFMGYACGFRDLLR
jgi:hypothetical protein